MPLQLKTPRLRKFYYQLTKYIPRRIPVTEDEFNQMKEIFIQAYGLEDHPKVWYTVASQLMAGDPTSLYRSYGKIANAAKKLNTAALVSIQHGLASQQLRDRLKETSLKVAYDIKTEETSSIPIKGAWRPEDPPEDPNGDQREIKPEWTDVPGQPHPDPDLPNGA